MFSFFGSSPIGSFLALPEPITLKLLHAFDKNSELCGEDDGAMSRPSDAEFRLMSGDNRDRVGDMMREERQALLDRARAGDASALGELLDGFRPYLAAIARARHGGRLMGKVGESDLAQDALLEAHRHFASFRGNTIEEFAGWLRQIVVNTTGHALRDHLDAAKRNADREQPLAGLSEVVAAADTSPSMRAVRLERSADIAAALARLPEDMQTVILGRHVDDLSYADLAEKLGRSEGAVRVLYTRALRRLREECGDDSSSSAPPSS